MPRFPRVPLLAALVAGVPGTSAQQPADTFYPAALSGNSVACADVSSSPTSQTKRIHAFAAEPSGQLRLIPGQPFTTPADGPLDLSLRVARLFVAHRDVDSFSIAAGVALRLAGRDNPGPVTRSRTSPPGKGGSKTSP